MVIWGRIGENLNNVLFGAPCLGDFFSLSLRKESLVYEIKAPYKFQIRFAPNDVNFPMRANPNRP
jgi:hypothetical protein